MLPGQGAGPGASPRCRSAAGRQGAVIARVARRHGPAAGAATDWQYDTYVHIPDEIRGRGGYASQFGGGYQANGFARGGAAASEAPTPAQGRKFFHGTFAASQRRDQQAVSMCSFVIIVGFRSRESPSSRSAKQGTVDSDGESVKPWARPVGFGCSRALLSRRESRAAWRAGDKYRLLAQACGRMGAPVPQLLDAPGVTRLVTACRAGNGVRAVSRYMNKSSKNEIFLPGWNTRGGVVAVFGNCRQG